MSLQCSRSANVGSVSLLTKLCLNVIGMIYGKETQSLSSGLLEFCRDANSSAIKERLLGSYIELSFIGAPFYIYLNYRRVRAVVQLTHCFPGAFGMYLDQEGYDPTNEYIYFWI